LSSTSWTSTPDARSVSLGQQGERSTTENRNAGDHSGGGNDLDGERDRRVADALAEDRHPR
jgi:hypothetical protein